MAEVFNMPKVNESTLTREKSSLTKAEHVEAHTIEKVELKGAVTVKKPSLLQKMKETFIKEDIRDVKDFIWWNIVVPSISRTINDIICGTSNRIFLGGQYQPQNLQSSKGTFVVPRNNYSATSTALKKQQSLPAPSTRVTFRFDDILFESYDDALMVLDRMVEYLEEYGQVSVNDFYDLIGRTNPFTTQAWGWKSLSNASIVATSGGYSIKLPNPIVIKE